MAKSHCRERVRSGVRFRVYCFGSSIGLLPHPAVDVPLALAIVALGVAVAAT